MNRVFLVLVLFVLLVLILDQAQGQEPCAPTIPADLVLGCYKGQVGAYSPSAREVLTWPIACDAVAPSPGLRPA